MGIIKKLTGEESFAFEERRDARKAEKRKKKEREGAKHKKKKNPLK